MWFLKAIVLHNILQQVLCLKILAIISLSHKSHYMAFEPFFRELSVRGHNVTVMNNFPDKKSPRNLTYINLSIGMPKQFPHRLEDYENKDSSYEHIFNFMRHIMSRSTIKKDCENLFENENVAAHVVEGHVYDVVFVEQFMSDCALVFAAAFYDAPIIGLTSHVLLPSAYSRLGIPFNPSSDPFYFSYGGSHPSFYHRLESAVGHFIFNTIGRWNIQRSIYEVFNRYLSNYTFNVEDIAKERMKMIFSYQHHSLTGPRMLAPQLLEVGGMHIGEPKPLPENLEKFLADARHGAIYVSFGSNLRLSTMSRGKLRQFLAAFQGLPQKVLIKWENSSFPEGYDNVYFQEWMPQLDILCHPKVVAFVSHGGMLSMSEAAHCGTPALAVPFFGDQFGNAAALSRAGLGLSLLFDQLNADTLASGIRKLTTREMQESAKRLSKLWHERPQSAMDSAIYWTEYVARHAGAPASLPSKETSWFTSSLLDVYFVILMVLTLSSLFLFVVLKLFLKIVNILISKKIKRD